MGSAKHAMAGEKAAHDRKEGNVDDGLDKLKERNAQLLAC